MTNYITTTLRHPEMALSNILNEGSGFFDFENSIGKTQNDH